MHKPSATLSPLFHRGSQHIKVGIANEQRAIDLVKKVPGRKWSKTHRCWYVPYTPGAYKLLQALFEVTVAGLPEQGRQMATATLPGPAPTKTAARPTGNTPPANPTAIRLELENTKRLKALVPPHEKAWIEKIKAIPGRAWNEKQGYWSLPLTRKVLGMLRDWSDGQVQPPPGIPDGLPEDYVPKNWRPDAPPTMAQPQAPAPASPGYPPGLRAALPGWILEQPQSPAAKPAQAQAGAACPTTPPKTAGQLDAQPLFQEIIKNGKKMKEYLYQRIRNDGISRSTHSGIYSALQAFYARALENPEKLSMLERPPKEHKLPRDLDKDEVARLIRATTNNKHKCLLSVMYSAGLRVGELVRIRLEDIDLDAKTVFVYQSKNNKDRYSVLGAKVVPLVQTYLAEHKPKYWLFESPDGEHYSERSVQMVFHRAKEVAKIKKNVSTHALRHSFATHNTAKGIDIELLRKLMGHESLKTTQIYLHVTKERLLGAPSPFDDLDI